MLIRGDMFESKPEDLDWTVRTREGSMLRGLFGEHHCKGEGPSGQLPPLSDLFQFPAIGPWDGYCGRQSREKSKVIRKDT